MCSFHARQLSWSPSSSTATMRSHLPTGFSEHPFPRCPSKTIADSHITLPLVWTPCSKDTVHFPALVALLIEGITRETGYRETGSQEYGSVVKEFTVHAWQSVFDLWDPHNGLEGKKQLRKVVLLCHMNPLPHYTWINTNFKKETYRNIFSLEQQKKIIC